MNVSSTHIVSSPFGDVDLPIVDLYSFITSDVWQYPDREALVSGHDDVVLCERVHLFTFTFRALSCSGAAVM